MRGRVVTCLRRRWTPRAASLSAAIQNDFAEAVIPVIKIRRDAIDLSKATPLGGGCEGVTMKAMLHGTEVCIKVCCDDLFIVLPGPKASI